ncbi:MAG TPA: ARMT1-like domain-containing protein [Clostridia bacterium]|nr:ARMT1-like domain-containing protein [Clostridia bacterium]
MKIFLDCLPCMLKQVLEATRMSTDDTQTQEEILMEAINILSEYKNYSCSPDLALAMHKTVKRHTGNNDPYEAVKQKDISAALKIYPKLKDFLKQKNNSLYWALKIAATGNIIDSAIYSNIDVEECVETELEKEFGLCDLEAFETKLKTAKTLLIIGDNSGETVFDKVLIEHLSPMLNMKYAVRSEPILNDATAKEACQSGLDEHVDIISSGSNAPGTILEKCNSTFIKLFNEADIIISKGQGNYEALSDCSRDIFFLLKAKCPMISKRFGVNLSDYVFIEHK